MPQPSFPFAAARVRSKENSLLTKEQLLRMNEAESPEAAMALLAEYGYETGDLAPEEYEKCIQKELDKACAFVEEVTPDKAATDMFFLRFDYHNLKVILKSKYRGVGGAVRNLVNRGTIDPREMLENVHEKRYSAFPKEMKEALADIDRRFSVKPDVSYLSFALDRAYAAQITAMAKKAKNPVVSEYYRTLFDFSNITSVLRLKRAGASRDAYERSMLPGGHIDEYALAKTYDMAEDEALAGLCRGTYARELTAAYENYKSTGSFDMFKKAEDEALIRMASSGRNDMFSAAPVLAYLILKSKEAEAVRMVMVGKLNGMEPAYIAELLAGSGAA